MISGVVTVSGVLAGLVVVAIGDVIIYEVVSVVVIPVIPV